MKTVSIITPAYNEEENIEALYLRIREIMAGVGRYPYEHIFIDNASTDSTAFILKRIAAQDPRVKVIINARNFGHIRSPMHALLQTAGDAVIGIASDFQEPPDLIPAMIDAWEQGNEMVLCVKRSSGESSLFFWLRKQYYAFVERVSSVETIQNYTGFGLYSRKAVDLVKSFNDPYPYFRGIIAEIGLPHTRLYFDQPARKRGFSKNNFYTLYDIAMLGITNLTKVPLRMMTFTGFAGALLSFLIALGYLVAKLLDWSKFQLGLAPLIIGIFFFSSIQLVFMGILGEYIGAIYTFVYKKPYAVERERIGFQNSFAMPDPPSASSSVAAQ